MGGRTVVSGHEVKKEITAATVARLPDRARPDKATPYTSGGDDQGRDSRGTGKGGIWNGSMARLTEGCHGHMGVSYADKSRERPMSKSSVPVGRFVQARSSPRPSGQRCVPGSLTSTTACQGLRSNEPRAVMGGGDWVVGTVRVTTAGLSCISGYLSNYPSNPATQSGPRPCRVRNLDAKPMTPPSTGLAGGMQQIGERRV